uniref:Uncharacterized protein n=1 Tax=Strongyloides stercoralis TaxID=6248 RepID=A0A0K0DSL6_STRER
MIFFKLKYKKKDDYMEKRQRKVYLFGFYLQKVIH